MKNIEKKYVEPFLVEPTKLGRVVDKIHERLSERPCKSLRDSFQAFLSGDRCE